MSSPEVGNQQKRLSGLKISLQFLADPERKTLTKILSELIALWVHYGEIPKHYFSRYLFKKDIQEVQNYLPNKLLYRLKGKFNNRAARNVLEDKLQFDHFFRPLGIPVPEILMYSVRDKFYLNGSVSLVKTQKDFGQLVLKLFDNRPELNSIFIKQTSWSYHGDNIFKVTRDRIQDMDFMADLYATLINNNYLYQVTISQHPDLQQFNPSCLNTLRIDTFTDKTGKVEVISAYLRTSVTRNFVDNDRNGGCEIPVDISTGKLKQHGHLSLKFHGLKRPEEHPQTGIIFSGFQIPHFKEVIALALRAGAAVPQLRLVGWDIALDTNGPVLIEGNSDYYIASSDLAYGGYRHHPIFAKVLQEANDISTL